MTPTNGPGTDDAYGSSASTPGRVYSAHASSDCTNVDITYRYGPGDNDAVNQSNEDSSCAQQRNVYISVRVDSPGSDGDVYQSNSSASCGATGQTNTNVSRRVGSSGAGGTASQSNSISCDVGGEQPDASGTSILQLNVSDITRSESNGDDAVGQSNSIIGGCSADFASFLCMQSNVALTGQGAGTQNGSTQSQSNEISGPDVCNAALADHQCGQSNLGLAYQSGFGSYDATQSQSNQISGRDGTVSDTGGGEGDSAAGICNVATAEHQCEQDNLAMAFQSGFGFGTNEATQSQSNQISGRDSTVTGTGGGDGSSGTGVCNAATAGHQCEQANSSLAYQSGFGTNGATQSQSNQISGRDSTVSGTGGGAGNDGTGVCNAATAEHQCEQANLVFASQLGLGFGMNEATQLQSNQISGRDGIVAGTGGGDGNNATGLCNAATAAGQCEQVNLGFASQLGFGFIMNDASQTQSNQISGRDSTLAGTGGGDGAGAAGVCNAATALHQCEPANTALTYQSSFGFGTSEASQSQSNQISGRDGTVAGTGGGVGDSAGGVCNAAEAAGQCNETNDAQIVGGQSQGTQWQSYSISGRDSPGGGGDPSSVCSSGSAERQCTQTNVASNDGS